MAHAFIDAAGNFRYIIIPAEQCIPVYETDYEEELVAMLRYYPAVVGGETKTRVEWWTAEGVSTYIETEAGVYDLESEDGHFFLNGTPMGWGRVPFVEFANNEERFADLKYYKEQIDVYDIIVSDLANDLTDVQKLLFVLKGYGGQSLSEFLQNLRYYRAIQVDPRRAPASRPSAPTRRSPRSILPWTAWRRTSPLRAGREYQD